MQSEKNRKSKSLERSSSSAGSTGGSGTGDGGSGEEKNKPKKFSIFSKAKTEDAVVDDNSRGTFYFFRHT